jgi:two-component system cell cycle sensor histidine kinase/response regulator CckA
LRATQARLIDSEARFRAMFECAPLGMMLLDHDGGMVMVNDPMSALLGVPSERLLHRSYLDHVAPDDEAAIRRCIDEAKTCTTECASVEHRLRPRQTSPREVRLTVAPATTLSRSDQLVATVEDVGVARRAERAERQARQREAVSRLASGVAHDFRNVLTALRLTTQSLLEETPDEAPWRREMEVLEQDASRAIELVRQLLALGRDEPHAPVPIDLGDMLRSELGMLRRLAGDAVSVVLELRRTLPPVYADHAGLQRVILNLVTNARDAMPDGGTLTITTDGPDDSGFVTIEVRDTGSGFSDDVAARIFEPFFSTKVLGHGSGLGLATAQSIVDRNGGEIEAESIAGEGAVFRVRLPAAAPEQRR